MSDLHIGSKYFPTLGHPGATWRRPLTDDEVQEAHVALNVTPFDPEAPILREAATVTWLDSNGQRCRFTRDQDGYFATPDVPSDQPIWRASTYAGKGIWYADDGSAAYVGSPRWWTRLWYWLRRIGDTE